jgi:hypothetical protein
LIILQYGIDEVCAPFYLVSPRNIKQYLHPIANYGNYTWIHKTILPLIQKNIAVALSVTLLSIRLERISAL